MELFFTLSIVISWVVFTTSLIFKLVTDDYYIPLGSRAANEAESAKYVETVKVKSNVDKVYGILESIIMKII